MRRAGLVVLALVTIPALAAPLLAPNAPDEEFRNLLMAPPTRVRVVDESGALRMPFFYPWKLADRLERRYVEDRSLAVPLGWFIEGRLAGSGALQTAPLMLLGADSHGRDIFSRLLYGARISFGLAAIAVVGALLIGVLIGATAGYAGGLIDDSLMRFAELVLVLPAIYVVLALRSIMPLVLEPWRVFHLLAVILALIGWPYVARAVRSIVALELRREYAEAATSLGAGHLRLLFRHILPACTGTVAVQATLLLPAFVLAEATLSFVGMGFPHPIPSLGGMLQEAADVSLIVDFPWVLSPAAVIFGLVLGVNLLVQGSKRTLIPGA
jgi:peptide/nickel transport system permease protein